MFQHDEFSLPIGKTKNKLELMFYLTNVTKKLIQKYKKDIEILIEKKENEIPIITLYGNNKPVSRIYLTSHINELLKEVWKIQSKKLSSHSFRIGLTTAIIETSGIDAVRAMIMYDKPFKYNNHCSLL